MKLVERDTYGFKVGDVFECVRADAFGVYTLGEGVSVTGFSPALTTPRFTDNKRCTVGMWKRILPEVDLEDYL